MSNENETKKQNDGELEAKKYKDEKIEKESQVTLDENGRMALLILIYF